MVLSGLFSHASVAGILAFPLLEGEMGRWRLPQKWHMSHDTDSDTIKNNSAPQSGQGYLCKIFHERWGAAVFRRRWRGGIKRPISSTCLVILVILTCLQLQWGTFASLRPVPEDGCFESTSWWAFWSSIRAWRTDEISLMRLVISYTVSFG